MKNFDLSSVVPCLFAVLLAAGCDRDVDNAFSTGEKNCSNGEVNVNGKCTPPQCAPGILWDKAACDKKDKAG